MNESFEKALKNAKIHVSDLLLQDEPDWEEIDKCIEKIKKYEEKIKRIK